MIQDTARLGDRTEPGRSDVSGGARRRSASRTVLQRAAMRNIRRHWARDLLRVAVLLVADSVAGGIVLVLLRLSVEHAAPIAPDVARALTGMYSWRLLLAFWLGLAVVGAYGPGHRRRHAGRAAAGAALGALFVTFGSLGRDPVGDFLLRLTIATLPAALAFPVMRALVETAVRRVRGSVIGKAVLVRAPRTGGRVPRTESDKPDGVRIVDVLQLTDDARSPLSEQLLPLADRIGRSGADTVVIWGDLRGADFSVAIDLALASGCRLLVGPQQQPTVGMEPHAVWVGDVPLVELTRPHLSAWQLGLKRTFDCAVAAFGLILLAPIFAAVAVTVKAASGGPVFFRQWRVGRAGRPFRIYKFRSMIEDAEARKEALNGASIYPDQRLFKVVNDPRVTRLGAWLRRASLDELPQLINVLLGHMSLVGPRPPVPSEVALYHEHHLCRFDVKPGMTGPWQVAGRNDIVDFESVLTLERDYIRSWSFAQDLKILVRTIPAVLRGQGAH